MMNSNTYHQTCLGLDLGLPDRPIVGSGRSRAFSGNVMEQVIIGLFGLTPGVIDGRQSVCPDAYTPADRPVEIKSLRRNDKLVVYDWRLAKDPDDQLYYIGIHNRKKKAERLCEVWTGLSETLDEVFILPVGLIRELAAKEPLRQIKMETTASGERNGYQRKGYKDGYRNIPFTTLRSVVQSAAERVSCELHGLRFEAQPLIVK